MIRFLIDQGLPRSVVALLRETGIDALHVGDIGMACATDTEIIAAAKVEGRIVVTLDADFHTLLALSGASKPSVIRIRIEGLKGTEIAHLILHVMHETRDQLGLGAAVVVAENKIRIKRLPIM